MLFRKIILCVFTISFAVIVNQVFAYFRASYSQSSEFSSFESFLTESKILKTMLSSHQEFNSISETLNRVEIFSEEGLIKLQKTLSAFDELLTTLNSTRYEDIELNEYEQTVREEIERIDQTLAELNISYVRLREVSQNIPFSLIYGETAGVFKEKSIQFHRLTDEYASCSIQQETVIGEIERAELEKNITLIEIEHLERLIQSKTSILRESFARLDIAEKELIESFKEVEINIQEISETEEKEFISESLRVLESSEKRIKEINELLIKLNSQTGDFGSAQINHFILVLDHSQSMTLHGRWNQVQKAVEYFIDANKNQGLHFLSIIVFANNAHIHFRAGRFFEYTPQQGFPWGNTNYDAAIEAVRYTIPLSKGRPIVLFLTDGEPTEWAKTYSILDNIYANYAQRGLMFFGFGVGQFNDRVLSELTKRANAGNEFFVNEKGKIQFLHTANNEKVIHEVFMNISDIVKHSGEGIDEKIRLLGNEKRAVIKEALSLIWTLQKSYYKRTTKSSVIEREESFSFVRKLEQKISLLLIENEHIQTHISSLHSRINQLSVISSSKLKTLRETYTQKKLQCSTIQTNLLRIQKEREAVRKLESNIELIERCEKFEYARQKLIDFMGPLINKLYLKRSFIDNSLKRASFSFVQEKIYSNAKFYLRQVFNKTEDYCQEPGDCFHKIFMEFFEMKHFESYFSKSEFLSIIFTHITNVEFLLAEETEEQIILILQEAIESMSIQKESYWSWSFRSVIKWVVKKIFFSSQTFQETVQEEMIQKEMENIREVFSLMRQEVRERYERFVWGEWQFEHEKIVKEFSSNFQEILS